MVVEIIEFFVLFITFCILIDAIFPRLKLVIIATDNRICKIKKFPYFSRPKSLIKIEKNLDDKKLLENVKKDKKISGFLEKKSIFKHIIVKNKLINLIVK